MTNQSIVCVCGTCVGTQCTCGCQNAAPAPAESCRCGEGCHCGESCSCNGCQRRNASTMEAR